MKLIELKASKYRSLREETVDFGDLNVFIGANASGKSTVLDALRFVHEGILARDFREAVHSRGGIIHLAWKGEGASRVKLTLQFQDGPDKYEWLVELNVAERYAFEVREEIHLIQPSQPPNKLLSSDNGVGRWWSGQEERWVQFELNSTACALASASVDTAFQARGIANFVDGWGFFDPNPLSLKRGGWGGIEPDRLDAYGRNLAERLYRLKEFSPDTFGSIITATKAVLGLPLELEPRESEGRYYFAQKEPGLAYPVHQIGTSTGTLRILALMTAMFEESSSGLVAIEEPENNIHPAALGDFTGYLTSASGKTQLVVTTHSPILLDFLEDPASVIVVRRDDVKGTKIIRENNPEGVKAALDASGFSLGEYHQTRGFGD